MTSLYSFYCIKCCSYTQIEFGEKNMNEEIYEHVQCERCGENIKFTQEVAKVDPKQAQGVKKIKFDNVPITLDIIATFGADNGAAKYGPWNWLEVEEGTMSLMTYLNAMKRHWILYRAGQDYASDSSVHHLDHLIAGLAVLRDAMIFGKINDDRVKLSKEQLTTLEKWINKDEYK